MDVESSSGYTIIPEHLRTQRLYMFLYTKRPVIPREVGINYQTKQVNAKVMEAGLF